MIEVPFNEADQVSLAQSGGYIALKPNNKVVFQFDTQEQYKKFLELKNQNK